MKASKAVELIETMHGAPGLRAAMGTAGCSCRTANKGHCVAPKVYHDVVSWVQTYVDHEAVQDLMSAASDRLDGLTRNAVFAETARTPAWSDDKPRLTDLVARLGP